MVMMTPYAWSHIRMKVPSSVRPVAPFFESMKSFSGDYVKNLIGSKNGAAGQTDEGIPPYSTYRIDDCLIGLDTVDLFRHRSTVHTPTVHDIQHRSRATVRSVPSSLALIRRTTQAHHGAVMRK
jgi:hypothetical protein